MQLGNLMVTKFAEPSERVGALGGKRRMKRTPPTAQLKALYSAPVTVTQV